ncbi:hypothetical protein [Capnocytophaga catalasegens]|uniref:Uncharacterized protein n=1 Tax=Capnocytophaga catalasegens TaxID=1004260 RepID=A0AAV5AVG6_9FLAO|nr:hypothetical protein [Capnocytophaga catalasegens]GIZ16043.1 hypothetical protein RCZ03_20430 [Capnocytophaga catalasegens]GJM51251.1 hypothetical protein RCZ15_22240 [Capnocytophaga catalasegens]GJM53333.1 hypothetical protein RCZ16_16500 [Capnocytophaga catalasegens]
MRNFLYLLLFLSTTIYAQKDTIVIKQSDINHIKKTSSHSPRGGIEITSYHALNNTGKPLDGFYKVIVGNNSFYTCYFEVGNKNSQVSNNIVKYYKDNKLYKIDIYYPEFYESTFYYTITPFDCKMKKVTIYKKNILREEVVDTLQAKKKISGKFVRYKVYNKKKSLNVFYPREDICECEKK